MKTENENKGKKEGKLFGYLNIFLEEIQERPDGKKRNFRGSRFNGV